MIKPEGSYVSLGGYQLFVTDVKYSFVNEYFDRQEFSHTRLNSAPNSVGQHALKTRLLGDTPAQIVIGTYSFQNVVPLNPDVTVTSSNFGNIKKKFNINRFEISGAASLPGNVASVYAIAQGHIQYLSVFQAYLDKSASMDTEYLELVALQSETFSYLTTTGVTLSGNPINGSVSNILITRFEPSVEYEVIVDAIGTSQLLQSFTLSCETRTISAKDVVV